MKDVKLKEMVRPELTAALERILDVFSGADGGGDYIIFMRFCRALDERVATGDESARVVLNIVLEFEALLRLSRVRR